MDWSDGAWEIGKIARRRLEERDRAIAGRRRGPGLGWLVWDACQRKTGAPVPDVETVIALGPPGALHPR